MNGRGEALFEIINRLVGLKKIMEVGDCGMSIYRLGKKEGKGIKEKGCVI